MKKLIVTMMVAACAVSLNAQTTNVPPQPPTVVFLPQGTNNLAGSIQDFGTQILGLLPQGTNFASASLAIHTGATLRNSQLENFFGADWHWSTDPTNVVGVFSGLDIQNSPSASSGVDALELRPLGIRKAGQNYELGLYPVFKDTFTGNGGGFETGYQGGIGIHASSHVIGQMQNLNGFIAMDILSDVHMPLKRAPVLQFKIGVQLLTF